MKGHKPWLVIGLVILLISGVALAGCAPKSSETEEDARTSQAQELYDFATEALNIWEEMKAITIDTYTLCAALDDKIPVDSSECVNLLNKLRETENRLVWLYAPPSAIEVKDSLIDQLDLIESCAYKACAACSFREKGDEVACTRYLGEAFQLLGGSLLVDGVSDENKRNLINLKLQAEQALKQ